MKTNSLLLEAEQLLNEAKATEVRVYDVFGRVIYANHVIICSGSSSVHLRALANRFERLFKSKGLKPTQKPKPSDADAGWMVLDYGDIVVHMMSPNKRSFYNLDELLDPKPK